MSYIHERVNDETRSASGKYRGNSEHQMAIDGPGKYADKADAFLVQYGSPEHVRESLALARSKPYKQV